MNLLTPLRKETADLLVQRAERYKDKLDREVKVLEASVNGAYGSPNEGVQLAKVEALRQDTAAAWFLARMAYGELAAQGETPAQRDARLRDKP